MSEGIEMVIALTKGERSPSFVRVCGSSVVARLAILAKRAGASRLYFEGEQADLERARALLSADARLEGCALAFDAPATDARPRFEALADVVVSGGIVKRLFASEGPAFVPGAERLRARGEPTAPLFEGEPPEGEHVLPVHDAADVAKARRVVLSHARSAGSSPVARHLHERFSQPLSRLLAELPVTANHVTFVNTVLGLLAAWYWSVGTLTALAIGGLLMQVTSVLDCVDGELARGKLLESKWGAWFDTVGDHVVNFAWVVGLAIGYGRFGATREVAWAPYVSTLSVAMVVLSFTLVAGLFLFLLVKRAGTKLKDVSASFREGETQKKSALFRLLDKLYVLGRRASIALLFTTFALLPLLTGLVFFYDVLFFASAVFLVFANLYFVLGALNTGLRAKREA